jgi:TolB-like protein
VKIGRKFLKCPAPLSNLLAVAAVLCTKLPEKALVISNGTPTNYFAMKTRLLSEITLAVLPFQALPGNDRIDTIAFGFTDDLIANFSRFNGISVISRFSTQHIRDAADVEAISRLGADYVVAGSLRSRADRLRIGVQLIRCPDFAVVFAQQYDETPGAVFETQDDIIQQIVCTTSQKEHWKATWKPGTTSRLP